MASIDCLSSDQHSPRPAPLQLRIPVELWFLIAEAIVGQPHYGRWRDLARLGWTCKAAYRAAHPMLWRNLTLVFRSSAPNEPQPPPPDHEAQGYWQDSDSLFESDTDSQSSLGSDADEMPQFGVPSTSLSHHDHNPDSIPNVEGEPIAEPADVDTDPGSDTWPYVDLDDKVMNKGLVERHRLVTESSVFPSYRRPLANQTLLERISRVAATKHHFLFPLIVLGGGLYLPSLVEAEVASTETEEECLSVVARINSGITSLWGRSMANIQIRDGLVLIPYPLHLVTQLTVSDLDSNFSLRRFKRNLTVEQLVSKWFPFLGAIPRQQVDTLRYFTNSMEWEPCIFSLLTQHFHSVRHFDWAYAETAHSRPLLSDHTRSMRFFHVHEYHEDTALQARLAELPNLAVFDEQGAGNVDLRAIVTNPKFQPLTPLCISTTLTSLSLDIALMAWGPPNAPFRTHLPVLTSLCVSFEVASLWFSSEFSFTAPLAGIPTSSALAFPALTHLTLTDVRHEPGNLDGSSDSVPFLPLAHMPKLAHFAIPFNHQFRLIEHCLSHEQVKQFSQVCHLQSLTLPSVDQIWSEDWSLNFNRHARPFSETVSHLTLQSHLFKDLHTDASFPGLTSLTLHAPPLTAVTRDTIRSAHIAMAALAHYPTLQTLDLHLPVIRGHMWLRIHQALPTLKHLVLRAKSHLGSCPMRRDGSLVTFAGLESLEVHLLGRPGNVVFGAMAFPALRSLTLVHAYTLDLTRTGMARLERLVVDCGPGRYVPPSVVEFATHPLLCPRLGIQFKCQEYGAPNAERAARADDLGSAKTLVMHFTGIADNRKSWQALAGEASCCGGHVVRLLPAAVKQTVEVKVAALPQGDRDAALIALALRQLLAQFESGSVVAMVAEWGLRAKGADLKAVKSAIESVGVECVVACQREE